MRPRVYFSFDRENDLYRACSVLFSVRDVVRPAEGFFSAPGEDQATSIARMELNLERTVVTVVLIGKNTSQCSWVDDELRLSVARGNALLGLYIHHMGEHGEREAPRGAKPLLPGDVWFPAYDWEGDVKHFGEAVEAAAGQSAKRQRSRPIYFPALGW